MFPSQGRAWVGRIALSSAILLSSLPSFFVPVLAAERPVSTLAKASDSKLDTSASAVRQRIIRAALVLEAKQEPLTAVLQAKTEIVSERKVEASEQKPSAKAEVKIAAVTSTTKASASSKISRGEASDKATEIVKNAQSLIGIPYVFGGTSRKGFDCSGFTGYVFQGSSIDLPRTSYSQYQTGVPVGKGEMKSGDLVFFSTYAKGASHVGIYIGGGSFIHAGGNGITTTRLTDSYYAARFLGARRIL